MSFINHFHVPSSNALLAHPFIKTLGYAACSFLRASTFQKLITSMFTFRCLRLAYEQFHSDELKGLVAVITGAGSGIGRLMALDLVKEGASVALWDINEEGIKQLCEEINAKGGNARYYVGDVSNRELVYASAKEVIRDFGRVDILINNAGIVSGKSILDVPDGLAEKTMQVNVIAHFWTVKAFLPAMLERDFGRIVTVASSAGTVGIPGLADYCASKHAAIGFDESLRLELRKLKKSGVRTICVRPFIINTGM
jgi:all-trans-retinol dehydrogenase (NAD+)